MNKSIFMLHPYDGCIVYGKLRIKNGKGYLFYYWKDDVDSVRKLVKEDGEFESISPDIRKCIEFQAITVCKMNYATLWSY